MGISPQRASPPFTPFHPFVNRVRVKVCACIKSSMLRKGTVGNEEESDLIKENYSLWRLMIDKKYQGQGFGRQTIDSAIVYGTFNSSPPDCAYCCLMSCSRQPVSKEAGCREYLRYSGRSFLRKRRLPMT